MPSALETLVKILKVEREQGYKNEAEAGGLAAYSSTWVGLAMQQARRPEAVALVEEIDGNLRAYGFLDGREARSKSVEYMLGRITGRIAPPPSVQARIAELHAQSASPAPPVPAAAPESGASPAHAAAPPPRPREAEAQRPPKPPKKLQPQQSPRPPQRSGDEGDDGGNRPEFSSLGPEFSGSTTPGTLDLPARVRLERPPREARPALSPEEAADRLHGLRAPVTVIKGIGEGLAERLQKLGIYTVWDMLQHLPRRYDDYTQLQFIRRLTPDQIVTVIGTIRSTETRVGRNNRRDFFMTVDDGTAPLSVTFFGQHFLINSLRKGQQVVLHGKTSIFGNRMQLTNPEWELVDIEDLRAIGIVPVYPLTEGLTNKTLRRHMKHAVEYWGERIPDYLPSVVLDRAELGDLGWAVRNLHFPESLDHLAHARRRLSFDQLLLIQLAVMGNRRAWQSTPAIPLAADDLQVAEFSESVFPYSLTGAQQRVLGEIRADLARDVPMNRLLQGDVGSGKTAVALSAMAITFFNGRQSALMAPTSILAEQHYRNISGMAESFPGERKPRVALLTGALSAGEREAVYAGLADGSIDMAVGTHALIQGGVEFRDLALAIVDEQHRFGVEERGALRGKGANPHLLVMTATPIPRTLTLTMYADLDLSLLDEMPPGRIPITTTVLQPVALEQAYLRMQGLLDQGQQAFLVFPLVEASDASEADSATEAFERLKPVFYRHKLGLLHGRMRPAEKDEIMRAFREREFDVLVTTSVAEVGVDIPNATVIIIHGANRFGLAQLHQFRGRVGRGGLPSYCLLVPDTQDKDAMDRLIALKINHDGFALAEVDWKLRGPGDLAGTRQSGSSAFRLMEGITPELVELAQREAKTVFAEDPDLALPEHQLLAERVAMLRDERSDLS
ncbi:MAG: ATP-dependent DNA helicase RecG [Anaerolineae bacterium]|nr:ATP-dependent DNA helicase RecG [Anaerolineae bacterium]